MIGRTIHILGVPLRSGSLMPGTENDAPRYREAGLLQRLTESGCRAIDEGDLAILSYLPHHTVPPVRNWPGPRIVWDLLADRIRPWLGEAGHLPLLIGCDCSVVAGSVQAFDAAADDLHVIYIDGDFDDAPPDPEACQSAAAMAVWLVTNRSSFRSGPALRPSLVTVLGWSKPSRSPGLVGHSISLQEVRRIGASKVVQALLASLPASANILVHFDIDVLADNEFPAAYFPHAEGLTMAELAEVLLPLLKDPRVRLVEVSEYSALRDMNCVWIDKLVGILSAALR